MVCLRDLVLFIYSVLHGRKFLWLLGLYTLRLTGTPGRCIVCLRDLVLFIYSVLHGHKFLWLLGLYTLHLTGTPCDLSFAQHTSLVD